MNIPPALLKGLVKQFVPKISELIDDAVQRAGQVELQEGEVTHMIQIWAIGGVAYIAGVAVDETGSPKRILFGPHPLKDYLDESLIKNINLNEL